MPTINWPDDLGYGKIVGRFAYMDGDDSDLDEEPNLTIVESGLVTIRPSVRAVRYTGVDGPMMLAARTTIGLIDSQGYICTTDDDGKTIGGRGIVLPATDETQLSPTDFTYSVEVKVPGFTFRTFNIKVPTDSVQDIGLIVPVPASGGVATVVDTSTADRAETAAGVAESYAQATVEALGQVPSISNVKTSVAEDIETDGTEIQTALNDAIDSPRTYTAPQTFDTEDGAAPVSLIPDAPMSWNSRTEAMNIGPDLQLRRHQGNAGQRLALVGRDTDTMPYMEVVAATRTGTDGGAAVAGYQLHLGPDDGAGNNREMFVIEAVGENHDDGPHFRIATHASGTGVRRPLLIKGGDATAFRFDDSGRITSYMPIQFSGDHSTLVSGHRNAGNQTAVQSVVYTTGSAIADVFLGVAGGRNDAPTPPPSGRVMGAYKFGSHNGTNRVDGAQIRAVTTEAWTFGSAEGNRMEFLIKKNGSASSTIAARVFDPAWNQAGLSILANTEGGDTATLKPVFIGPEDSAGTGYRTLRIAN